MTESRRAGGPVLAAGEEPPASGYGARLRLIRESRGLRLSDVTAGTGISAGFLSKIERDRANPSLGQLKRLTSFYGVPLVALFDAEPTDQVVVRAGQGRPIEVGGIEMRLLSPRMGGRLEAVLAQHPPGSESGVTYEHDGEEINYILQGELIYFLGEEQHRLRAGDSIYHRSNVPHGWKNPGPNMAVVLTVVTPPSFLL